jgi:hypothetical protein
MGWLGSLDVDAFMSSTRFGAENSDDDAENDDTYAEEGRTAAALRRASKKLGVDFMDGYGTTEKTMSHKAILNGVRHCRCERRAVCF